MAKALKYPLANRTAQNFSDNYPGVKVNNLYRLVIHTTEGSGWPGYSGGAMAPTLTALPDYANKRLVWRQHFDMNESARALENRAGGVLTNTSGIVQIELIGTSDKNGPGMYWPEAPDWALQDLADFILWLQKEWAVPAKSTVKWVAYPASYGNTDTRLTGAEWNAYRGVCGHQHVPENDHGDPGALPWSRLSRFLQEEFVLATKEEVKAALAEVIAANLDDIAAAVAKAPVTRMWDGKGSTLGATLASTQYYAIQGGFAGVNPDTASSAPGADTTALQSRTAQKAIADQLVTVSRVVADLAAKVEALSAKVDALTPTQPTS